MTQNRKRCRSMKEDEVEFMPLSKRINNLHINNSMLLDGSSQGIEWGPGPPYLASNVNMPESPPDSVQSVDWNSGAAGGSQYSPELSESQNPYYFTINKLLYEMYLARQQRSNN